MALSAVRRSANAKKIKQKTKSSKETGVIQGKQLVKMFLQGYSYLMAAMAIITSLVLVVLLFRMPFLEPFKTTKMLHKSLDDSFQEASAASNNMIVFTFIALASAISASLCKKAMEEGLAKEIKQLFYALVTFVVMDVILQLRTFPHSTFSIFWYFELPRCMFALLGIAVTYMHIQQKFTD